MKRWILALLLLPGGLFAQANLVGTWQGTLNAGKELRIVVKVSTTEADGLKASLYSIDQGGATLPASNITLQGSAVKMTVPGIGGTYEGRLSADGNTVAGTWTQGPTPLPLNLTRATPQTAWAIPDAPPPPKIMAADANPVFEVATIKPSKPDQPGKSLVWRGRQFATTNTTLADLLTFAYGVHLRQVTGGAAGVPAWVESDKFDLVGQPDIEGQPSDKQLRTMLQKVLTDRFHLTLHRDKKELTAYLIVPAKTPVKLTKSSGDPNGLPGLGFRGLGSLAARNANMTDFAGLMQTLVLDRPVVDRSGLEGRFDFSLNWTPDETQFGGRGGQASPPAAGEAPPDLYTAIQQQLGLKLESAKVPVDVLVIDKVEKPSEN